MYAIAGVSGHTGSVAADELLRRGKKVRVIVRHAEKGAPWKAKGAEVALASLDNADELARALSGVEGVYLLSPPDPASKDMIGGGRRLGEVYASAVKKSGLPHVVFLSSIGAQHDSGTGPIRALHEIEKKLVPAGTALTLLRPSYFLENWAASLGPAAKDGVLPSFIPADTKMPQIATKDIGIAAADALEAPPKGVRILELAGPQDYSPNDIAGEVGKILGKKVIVGAGPLDAVVPAFMSFGIGEHVAGLYREMYEGLIQGRVSWDGKGERKRGKTTPAEVLGPMLQ